MLRLLPALALLGACRTLLAAAPSEPVPLPAAQTAGYVARDGRLVADDHYYLEGEEGFRIEAEKATSIFWPGYHPYRVVEEAEASGGAFIVSPPWLFYGIVVTEGGDYTVSFLMRKIPGQAPPEDPTRLNFLLDGKPQKGAMVGAAVDEERQNPPPWVRQDAAVVTLTPGTHLLRFNPLSGYQIDCLLIERGGEAVQIGPRATGLEETGLELEEELGGVADELMAEELRKEGRQAVLEKLAPSPAVTATQLRFVSAPIHPRRVAAWQRVRLAGELRGLTPQLAASLDGGENWTELPADGDLSGLPVRGDGEDELRLRLLLAPDPQTPPPVLEGVELAYAPSREGWPAAATAPAGEGVVRHAGPGGIVFTVTERGLTSIVRGERLLASGGWEALDLGPVTGRACTPTPGGARVRHRHERGRVTYTYAFDGEDVVITARFENGLDAPALETLRAGGLTFHYLRKPEGLLWGGGNRDVTSSKMFHPGFWNRIAGSHGTDGTFGVGATPWRTAFHETLLLWHHKRTFHYYERRPLPPGGAQTVRVRLRVSNRTEWQHLMGPYKEFIYANYGRRQYDRPDHRMVGMKVIAARPWIEPGNPYGYARARRLDRPGSIEQSMTRLAQLRVSGDSKGCIWWAQGGWDPRGCMFRSDFDVLPPPAQESWPIIDRVFDAHNLQHGVCARPGILTYRVHWTGDNFVGVNPDDPTHVADVVRRFRNMMERGCTLFYVDAFGRRPDEVKLMHKIRDAIGPGPQTFVEHTCDLVLPVSGSYFDLIYKGHPTDPERTYRLRWLNLDFWRKARWLFPETPTVVAANNPDSSSPGYAEQKYHWLWRHGLTPMTHGHGFGIGPEAAKALQAQFLDEEGHWRRTDDESRGDQP